MPLVVGIDEAGYGPLLGPLVVGATLWRVAPAHIGGDWWGRLTGSVCRTAKHRDGRVPVGDSKVLFDRQGGIATLERSVLAFARAAGMQWATAGDLLAALGFEHGGSSHTIPWYRDWSGRLPLDAARSAFEGAAQRLGETMAAGGVTCCGLRAEVVPEDAFNQRVAQTRNKAVVVVEAVLRLTEWAARHCRDQDLYILVDRLGGRIDYRAVLMGAFPARHLHVLEVGAARSRYRLASQENDWYVEFAVEGEQRHMAVALASMLAKYLRELVMDRFNAYWRGLAPDLRPTAGYYTDAQRFLMEIEPLLQRGVVPREQFVRMR